MNHIIVFKATFDNVSKISAINADVEHLYKALNDQCANLFDCGETPLQISYTDHQQNKLTIEDSQDILNALAVFKDDQLLNIMVEAIVAPDQPMTSEEQLDGFSIPPLKKHERWMKFAEMRKKREAIRSLKKQQKLQRAEMKQLEKIRKADAKKVEKQLPVQQAVSEETTVENVPVLQETQEAEIESAITTTETKVERKTLAKMERLQKVAEMKKRRAAIKELKKGERLMQKQQRLVNRQVAKEQKTDSKSGKRKLCRGGKQRQQLDQKTPDEKKPVKTFEEKLQRLELKAKELNLKEGTKIDRIRQRFEKKRGRLQQNQDNYRMKQQVKQLIAQYPGGIKSVYVQGEAFLKKRPFKDMVESGRLEQALAVLIATNSAFNLKMQSTVSDHNVQVIIHKNDVESDEGVVDLIATANEAKNVGNLDSCLFVCAGHEFKQLRRMGAFTIRPHAWYKVMTNSTV